MESFLNILWVVLAICSLCLWRMRWAEQPRETNHVAWRQWTAFVCALILLFFMVSLTDDLHSELVMFEESSASRRDAHCVACPHHPPSPHSAGATFAILDRPGLAVDFSHFALLSSRADLPVADPIPIPLAGRAPPDLSL